MQPDQRQAPAGSDGETRGRNARQLEGLDGQTQDMLRMGLGMVGLVVVQVDEQGVELGELADQPPAAEEAVLGQIDVGLALQLPHHIAEIGDRHRCLAPAAAMKAPGNTDPAAAAGMQGKGMIGGVAQA